MKYNIEVDSETKFVIRFALSTRIEFIKKELAIAEQHKIESSVKYWQGEMNSVTNAVAVLDNNIKVIW
jgi:prophage DNA circulation protein